ncbi:MAG: tetratricopeptide repeat protein [Planctomycetota bacterium]|jgi:tetratricopeptide (TPR) repeat protein
MSRTVFIALVLFGALFIAGCLPEETRDDPRFRMDPAQDAVAEDTGFTMPGAEEVDLVEQMAAHRAEYRASLVGLMDYYTAAGNANKLWWAQQELALLDRGPQYRYLMPAEAAHTALAATDSIAEADVLFEDAMKVYREAGGLIIITDENKLRTALKMFDKVITDYPTSDKIDDAAYRAGRIYEYFKDYEIAAVYYQRTFQWNDNTPYPARYRAAFVLDQHLHMRAESLPLYQAALEKESRYKANTEFAERRVLSMTKSEATPPE